MNIRFEMRFKCGGKLKVFDPFLAVGKTLTFFDAVNGASNHGFARLGIQTFSYCTGANDRILFIFPGKSP